MYPHCLGDCVNCQYSGVLLQGFTGKVHLFSWRNLVGTFIFLEKLLRKHAGPATHCTDARRRRLRPCCTPSRPRGFPRWTGGLHVCSFEFTDCLLVPGPTAISPGSPELSRSYGIWRAVGRSYITITITAGALGLRLVCSHAVCVCMCRCGRCVCLRVLRVLRAVAPHSVCPSQLFRPLQCLRSVARRMRC